MEAVGGSCDCAFFSGSSGFGLLARWRSHSVTEPSRRPPRICGFADLRICGRSYRGLLVPRCSAPAQAAAKVESWWLTAASYSELCPWSAGSALSKCRGSSAFLTAPSPRRTDTAGQNPGPCTQFSITLVPFKLLQGLNFKPDTRGDHILARLLPLLHFPHFLFFLFSWDHPLNNTLAKYSSFQDQLLGSLFQNRHQENSSGIGISLPIFKVVLVVKNPPASAGDLKDMASIPGSGRSRGGHGHPLQYSSLENPVDWGAGQATVHRLQRIKHDWNDLADTQHAPTFKTWSMNGELQGYGCVWTSQECCYTVAKLG